MLEIILCAAAAFISVLISFVRTIKRQICLVRHKCQKRREKQSLKETITQSATLAKKTPAAASDQSAGFV
jgi:hypothetical protein